MGKFTPLMVIVAVVLLFTGITNAAADTAESNPQFAEVVSQFDTDLSGMIAGRNIGLDFMRVNARGEIDFRLQYNADALLPVASSFKAFAAACYFLNVPGSQWRYTEGSPVYSMTVFSNNGRTGEILQQIGEGAGAENPIVAFNDCLQNELGMQHGLYSWEWPNTPTIGYTDPRFMPGGERAVQHAGNSFNVSNVSTAADIANGYLWLATAHLTDRWTEPDFPGAITLTRSRLAITAPGYPSIIERSLLKESFWGKDGVLRVGDVPTMPFQVLNDAVVIPRNDGSFYIISFLSVGESEGSLKPIVDEIVLQMSEYETLVNPDLYVLEGESYPVQMGTYNYGFVPRSNIELFTAPSEDAERFTNFSRPGSIYGTNFVYRGALLRILPVDDTWGQIIIDEQVDDIYGFRTLYVRLADLQFMDPASVAPLGNLGSDPDAPKLIVINVADREMTLLEGGVVVLKTPVIINSELTPNGFFYINRRTITRNMPGWPGVPFASYLYASGEGNEYLSAGYAIHGMPPQLWSQTVNDGNIRGRVTSGCINMPDWAIEIAGEIRRVDETVFRWIGGNSDPSLLSAEIENSMQPVRVISYPNLDQIPAMGWQLPLWYSQNGVTWGSIIDAVQSAEVQAPSSFFVLNNS